MNRRLELLSFWHDLLHISRVLIELGVLLLLFFTFLVLSQMKILFCNVLQQALLEYIYILKPVVLGISLLTGKLKELSN